MNFINYNTNGTFWIQGSIFICPHCGAVNPFQHGTYFCHNCRKVVGVNPNTYSTGSYSFNKNKKITEISQILEVLEQNNLLEKDAYFNESKYYGDFVQIYEVLTGWHIMLIKESMGTKITFENNHIQTVGDLELIVVRFRNI